MVCLANRRAQPDTAAKRFTPGFVPVRSGTPARSRTMSAAVFLLFERYNGAKQQGVAVWMSRHSYSLSDPLSDLKAAAG